MRRQKLEGPHAARQRRGTALLPPAAVLRPGASPQTISDSRVSHVLCLRRTAARRSNLLTNRQPRLLAPYIRQSALFSSSSRNARSRGPTLPKAARGERSSLCGAACRFFAAGPAALPTFHPAMRNGWPNRSPRPPSTPAAVSRNSTKSNPPPAIRRIDAIAGVLLLRDRLALARHCGSATNGCRLTSDLPTGDRNVKATPLDSAGRSLRPPPMRRRPSLCSAVRLLLVVGVGGC